MSDPIFFRGKADLFFELSNFFPAGFKEDGIEWPTVEHYYQAQKFLNSDYREKIRLASTPHESKILGHARTIEREEWENIKEEVMLHALVKKFSAPHLRRVLMSTGDRHLVENSPHDDYWGSGADGRGRNRLGHLLMKTREVLRAPHSLHLPSLR
jgi:hypothetical protein